jgi:hypothetical protein
LPNHLFVVFQHLFVQHIPFVVVVFIVLQSNELGVQQKELGGEEIELRGEEIGAGGEGSGVAKRPREVQTEDEQGHIARKQQQQEQEKHQEQDKHQEQEQERIAPPST